MGRASGPFEDVGQLGNPFIVVDAGTFGRIHKAGGETKDGVRDVVEAIADLLAEQLPNGGGSETNEKRYQDGDVPVHAVLP